MNAEFTKLTNKPQARTKAFPEMIERNMQNEIRELKNEETRLSKIIEFAHSEIADLKKRLLVETANNGRIEADCSFLPSLTMRRS